MKYLIILSLGLIPWVTFSQTLLEGKIKDNETQEPLIGVSIYIPDLQIGAISDADGKFSVQIDQKGIFKVQFSYVGFETIIKTIDFTKPSDPLEIQMEHSVVEAHEIVVSAGYPSSQEENPVKIDELSKDEMDKAGGVTLMDGLSKVPGVTQVSTGAGIGKPVIRGLSFNRVVTFNQGIRVENQQWGAEHGLGVSDIGVDKVEIIKGPSSLLYGSDAMGGVLHILDEKPPHVGKIVSSINTKVFSNTMGTNTDAGIKGATKKIRYGLRAGLKEHGDYMDAENHRIENSRFSSRDLKAKIGFNLPFASTNFQYTFMENNLGLPGLTHADDEQGEEEHHEQEEEDEERKSIYEVANPYQLIQNHTFSTQNTFFLEKSKLKVNAGYTLNNRKEFEDPHAHEEEGEQHHEEGEHHHEEEEEHDPGEPNLEMDLNTFSYDIKYYLPPGKNTEYIFGLQGMNQNNTNSGNELLIPDANVMDIGAMALMKYSKNDWNIQTGMRYDRRQINVHVTSIGAEIFPSFKRQFNALTGALGGNKRIKENWVIRFNLASGYRAPNLSELTSNGVHHGTNRFEVGEQTLKNEQNFQPDLGLHFHSKHLTFDLSLFYNQVNNFIYLQPLDSIEDGVAVYKYQQQDANLRGGEFSIDIHPHPLDWLHIETIFSTVRGHLNNGVPLPLIPADRLINELRVEFEGKKRLLEKYIRLNIMTVMGQENPNPRETRTGGYAIFNAGLGGTILIGNQHLKANISCNNLFNRKYIDHLSRLKPNGILNPGRNIVVSLSVPIGIKN